MYIYKDIAFRPIEYDDLEVLRKLHNDMTTLLNLGNPQMVTSEEQVEWWKSISLSKTIRRYCILGGERYERIIGMLRVQNIDHLNKNCEIGLDILAEHRKRGYGRKSYEMVLQYLFLHLNIHTIYLRVIDSNERARSLYEEIGFQLTGKYPEFIYRNGKYQDYLIMSMTRQMYDARYRG